MTPKEYAELLRNNPELRVRDDGRGQAPAPYRLTQAKAAPASPAPTEHEEQVALFEWAAANEVQEPALSMLHATPNGGYRPAHTAALMKAEGQKAGYPDISLDVARWRWHGMRIELKRSNRTHHPTPEQREWLERLTAHGYLAICCYGADEAINAIQHYQIGRASCRERV